MVTAGVMTKIFCVVEDDSSEEKINKPLRAFHCLFFPLDTDTMSQSQLRDVLGIFLFVYVCGGACVCMCGLS